MPGRYASIEVGPPAEPGRSRPRRFAATAGKLVESPAPDVEVVADLLGYSVRTRPDRQAVGWRETIRLHNEEKQVKKMVNGEETTETKKWTYYEMSDYKYLTYKQLGEMVADVASALVETGHSRSTIFNIYASTSAHWQVMANACATQGITFATAYDNLGEEGLNHSLNEPGVYGMFTNAALLPVVAGVIANTPTVKVLVYDGATSDVKPAVLDSLKKADIKLFHWDEFVALGRKSPHPANKPSKDDVACIMYTSGSTGAPKGVEITNRQITAVVGGALSLVHEFITPDARFIAYLPLSHIFEMAVEFLLLYVGIVIGYGSVKTLTDTSMRNCMGDMRAFQPTIMVGVPTVWEQIRKGILAKVSAGPKFRSSLFHGALSAKKGTKPLPVFGRALGGVLDAVVFKAVKQATGGRLKYAINGGAGISRDTQNFLRLTLTDTLIQGWGLTESCALSCILPPAIVQTGPVGVPVPCVEIQLRDFEEAGYKADGSGKDAGGLQQGEICLRGPSIFKGYFKRPDLTKEVIDEDGWFMTGDIGQWNRDGTLSIIDRKKNLVKLAGGEYVALERLESIYKSCNLVSNICVHADPSASRPMAIIVPHEQNLRTSLSANPHLVDGKSVDSLDWATDVCANDKVKKHVLEELVATGRGAGLKPLETLQTVLLAKEEWTPQNGMLTPAQKLQRKSILQSFGGDIKKVYP
ncbi:long-chain fatty acid-CoA ligase [Rhodotorula toruloides]